MRPVRKLRIEQKKGLSKAALSLLAKPLSGAKRTDCDQRGSASYEMPDWKTARRTQATHGALRWLTISALD
jgi:hypothetical protein